MACNNGNNPILPEELLIEIFLRSSVESLLRVKCVCKHWYGVIKDHSFAYKHFQYHKNRKMHRLLLQTENDHHGKHIYSYSVLDDKTQSSTSLQNLYMIGHFITMGGPVDGLCCLYNGDDSVVLWNPALKDFKLLPIPPPPSFLHRIAYGHVGFGIDPLTNDYKVVLIQYFYGPDGPMLPDPVVTLYSLITNSWKPIDFGDSPLHIHPTKNLSNSFLNGTCHWWHSGDVLAFDLGNESFRVIPGPNFSHLDRRCDFTNMGVYEERVVVWRSDRTSVYIWVMLEEGIWTEQVSIGPLPYLVWPCGFWNNRGPLFAYGSDETRSDRNSRPMVLYDINTREIRNLGPRGRDGSLQAWDYFESFVSFEGGTNYDEIMVSDFLNERPLM